MNKVVYEIHRGESLRPSSEAGAGLLALVLLMVALGGISAALPTGSPEPAAVVEMTNTLKFTPDTVTVQVGETVRWENTSLVAHTVTADPAEATMEESVQLPEGAEPFDSGTLDPEASFKHTFEAPGTYRYFCIPHEAAQMQGTVIVEP